MKFIDISVEDYSNLRSELNEFVALAKTHNHNPSKEEFDDIIKFILLYQSGTSTLCESYSSGESSSEKLLNQLYESFNLNEDEKDFDSAFGTVKTAGLAAGAGALAAGVGAAILISYLFKRKKVRKSIEAEFEPDFQRLKTYEKINSLKAELHELKEEKGEPKTKTPGLTKVAATSKASTKDTEEPKKKPKKQKIKK